VIDKFRVSASVCAEGEQNMTAVLCGKQNSVCFESTDLTMKTTEMYFSASKHSSVVNSLLWLCVKQHNFELISTYVAMMSSPR